MEKFKLKGSEELTSELEARLKMDKHAAHAMLARDAGGAFVIVAVDDACGKMRCNICKNQPNIEAGKSHSGTLTHLISPGHYKVWYEGRHSDVKLNEEEMRASYNGFAHGKYKNKCSCHECRPNASSKRQRTCLPANGPNTAMVPPPPPPPPPPLGAATMAATMAATGLGNMSGWNPFQTAHAQTTTY